MYNTSAQRSWSFVVAGSRCDVCADNHYGNPEEVGGSCHLCNCSNNIDISHPGNCDPHTGKCLKCLFNTDGDNCERCKDNFYLDERNQLCTGITFSFLNLICWGIIRGFVVFVTWFPFCISSWFPVLLSHNVECSSRCIK